MKGMLIALIACATAATAPLRAADLPAGATHVERSTSRASSLSQGRGRGAVKKAERGKKATREYREVRVPAGTSLSLELRTPLASDRSRVEDPVRARLAEAVRIDGETVLPAGTPVVGHITDVERPGRVKGRGRIALRITRLSHNGEEYDVRTREIERSAESTKGQDAAKVGIGAGAGAAVGAILGGGDGAATGAAIGAAAGTGTVLATKGDELSLGVGELLETKLTAPVAVLVRTR